MTIRLLTTAATLTLLAGCASVTPAQRADDLGVLVMAHGGSKQWNKEVLAAIEPLKNEHNIEVAFGMADAASLQQGVQRLEARGARRVTIIAHPEDARFIEQALALVQAGGAAHVLADPERPRGSLRLDTDIGVLDADLAPQLDRLLPKLRESLRHG